MAPTNSKKTVSMTWVNVQPWRKPPAQSPIVTAGLRCATPPATATLVRTPMNTAIPHAQVITIHPEFCAFDLFNKTPATTPSPNTISVAVPTTSPRYGFGTAMLPTTPFLSRAVAPGGADPGRAMGPLALPNSNCRDRHPGCDDPERCSASSDIARRMMQV